MNPNFLRRIARATAVASLLLVAGLAFGSDATAQTAGSIADAQSRLVHPQLAWDTTSCPGAPISYADDVLLGIGLDQSEVAAAESTISNHGALSHTTTAAFGVTVFHLAPGSAAEMRGEVRNLHPTIDLQLNHIFFYSPHWRFSPFERPAATTRSADDVVAFDPFGEARRPIVVIDTGYPHEMEDPTGYTLMSGSRTTVDPNAPTAYHGPFIASQIVELVPGADVRLQRMLTERGAISTVPLPTGEEIFDEVALIETLQAVGLHELGNAVVNLSFGTYGCEGHEPQALAAALHALGDIDLVAAAGNDETGALQYPASFEGALDHRVHSVGAHDGYLFGPLRACFSNYGNVEIWAPGAGVLGRIPDGAGGILAEASGTSFAAPYVSAALAADIDVYGNRFPFTTQMTTPANPAAGTVMVSVGEGPAIAETLDLGIGDEPYPGATSCP